MRLILFICLGWSTFLSASNGIYLHVNLNPKPNVGMFSVFSYLAGVLHEFESNDYAGLKVDFENNGLYYDPQHGPNWWEYYCKPISIENDTASSIKKFDRREYGKHSQYLQRNLSRDQVFDLIKKYIHIKENIQEKIDKFVSENFTENYIIGVHYRGTDKVEEAPRIPYSKVFESIKKYVDENALTNFKIFVASDESQFVDFMKRKFGDSVITYSTVRSDNRDQPLHFQSSNTYLSGEEALIDCILLSKGNVLFKTSSNLSLWSTYFNPKIPVITLSVRYSWGRFVQN